MSRPSPFCKLLQRFSPWAPRTQSNASPPHHVHVSESLLRLPSGESEHLSTSLSLLLGEETPALRRAQMEKVREELHHKLIFQSWLPPPTSRFSAVPECALMYCWDAAGQHKYMKTLSIFIQSASTLLFLLNLKLQSTFHKQTVKIKELPH